MVVCSAEFDQVRHFWCPLLGQPINFGYCRRYQKGLPCSRLMTCYQAHFDVAAYVRDNYSPEERAAFLAQPPGRLETMAQALAKAEAEKDPS